MTALKSAADFTHLDRELKSSLALALRSWREINLSEPFSRFISLAQDIFKLYDDSGIAFLLSLSLFSVAQRATLLKSRLSSRLASLEDNSKTLDEEMSIITLHST